MAKLLQYRVFIFQLLLFWFFFNTAHAQHDCSLIIHPVSTDSSTIVLLNVQNNFSSKANCIQYVNRLPSLLATKGYVAASVDSVWEGSQSVSIRLFAGNK